MTRIARLVAPGTVHHVISRFVDRSWKLQDDEERGRYLELLSRALAATDWRCLAYCLMSSHVHLAFVAGRDRLESVAKRIHSPLARWLNERYGRLGPVFADRPAAFAIPPQREAELIAYIHNNPVRARVVSRARDSSWSSHRAYLGLAPAPPWLHVAEGLLRSGCPECPRQFERLVDGRAASALPSPDLQATRAAARRRGAFELATPTLSTRPEVPIVARAFALPRVAPERVFEVVCASLGLTARAVTRRWARGDVAVAKRVAVHVAIALGLSISDAAASLHISRQRGAVLARARLPPVERARVDELVRHIVRASSGQE